MSKNNNLPSNRQAVEKIVSTSAQTRKLKTIFRAKHQTDYTIISNFPLQDKRLSFKARGVLAYLLAKPDDWIVKAVELNDASPQGKRAVQSALKELRTFGYANLAWIKNGQNRMQSQYFVSELPVASWVDPTFSSDQTAKVYTRSPFEETFTREYQATEFLKRAKAIFIKRYNAKFEAKFTFDRRHTKAIKNLLLAIVDSVEIHFDGKATNDQILLGFNNLLTKAVVKCKTTEQFTPSYILHILHTLRAKNPLLR